MSVAIVIPSLRCGPYIERCLRSACGQTVPCEVIVVDGGSEDGSREIAARYGVEWIEAPPRGMADARNIGIEATDADYIVPLDADDWIEPTFVERCMEQMHPATRGQRAVGVVATGLRWPDGRVQWPKEPITIDALRCENRLFTCSLVRRDCWREVGGYRDYRRVYEDWLFYGMVAAAGWRFGVVREPLYHYCPRPGSSCAQMKPGDDADYCQRTREMLCV